MGEESDQDVAIAKRPISLGFALWTIIQVLIIDFILYGCLIPLLGTFLGGYLAYGFNLGPKTELVCIVFTTFSMIYCTFCLVGEASYWKHLFAFDRFYCILLQIRDVLNTCLLFLCLVCVFSSVEAIINEDKALKPGHLSEGVVHIFLKGLCHYLRVDESILTKLGFPAPRTGFLGFGGEGPRYEHGATFMLFWAMLTGCVAKLVYFNTLFTYMRAMEIFLSMKPIFVDEDDYESSTSMVSVRRNRKSRMENDFASSVRNSNWDED